MSYSNCVQYATGRNYMNEIETEWDRLGNSRTNDNLITAVNGVLRNGTYGAEGTPQNGKDIQVVGAGAGAAKIAVGIKTVGQGKVMHFVRKVGNQWRGCPGHGSVNMNYTAIVGNTIVQKKAMNSKDTYSKVMEFWVSPPAVVGFPSTGDQA